MLPTNLLIGQIYITIGQLFQIWFKGYYITLLIKCSFFKRLHANCNFFLLEDENCKRDTFERTTNDILDKKRMHQHPLSNVNYLFSILLQANC